MERSGVSETDRQQRAFFYVENDGSRVVRVTGYICAGADGYWWCPELGVSAAEGYSLFRDRTDAYTAAYNRARHHVELAQANLARIDEERWA
jgi:hypothetical protein